MSSVRGVPAFRGRAARCRQALLEVQADDGGWGVTTDSTSSIVNTAEALYVLRLDHEVPSDPEVRAAGYIGASLPAHARPRSDGGRGANTRFVAFGLLGLGLYHGIAASPSGLEAIDWALGWLDKHRTRDGWPERAGDVDTSLHQTAVTLYALSELHADLAPLTTALGEGNGRRVALIAELASHATRGLLWHQQTGGGWPSHTFGEAAPSPSKTGLAIMALESAARSATIDGVTRYATHGGYGPACNRLETIVDATRNGAERLSLIHSRWESYVESDPEVPGTDWIHPAYAIALAGCLAGGIQASARALQPAFKFLDRLWNPGLAMWQEPGGRVTIRSAFHVSRAYRYAVLRESDTLWSETLTAEVTVVQLLRMHGRTLQIQSTLGSFSVPLTERQAHLLSHIGRNSEGLTPQDIADRMSLQRTSVAQYVRRTNLRVRECTGSLIGNVIELDSEGRYAIEYHFETGE